jgi:hypothetical protein
MLRLAHRAGAWLCVGLLVVALGGALASGGRWLLTAPRFAVERVEVAGQSQFSADEVEVSRPEGPVLYMLDGVEVRLGSEDWDERLGRLGGVLAQLRASGQRATSIDLRFRDQVVLRTEGRSPGDRPGRARAVAGRFSGARLPKSWRGFHGAGSQGACRCGPEHPRGLRNVPITQRRDARGILPGPRHGPCSV